jgi:hypothetical protein
VKKLYKKQSSDFRFAKEYNDFESLPSDTPYIYDGEIEVTANPGEVIMFPRADVPVGEEVCVIGEFTE